MHRYSFTLALALLGSNGCTSENANTELKEATAKQTTDNRFLIAANGKARDGLYQQAVDLYQKALELEPKNVEINRNLGIVLIKVGDYKGGVDQLSRAIRRFDDNFTANFYLAEGLRGQERFADAIFRYKRAASLRPEHPDVLRALAWSYFRTRFYGEALRTVNKLLELNSNDGQAAIIKARTLVAMERPNQALKIIRQAKLSANEDTLPYFHSVEGDVLATQNDCELAKKIYIQALKKQPLLAGSLLGLGRCYQQEGDHDKAIRYITRAARIKPRLKEAYYLLGKAYATTDRVKAIKFLQKFRKLAAADPEFTKQLRDTKNKLAELKSTSE